jgi:putative ATP-binding cassette transporter
VDRLLTFHHAVERAAAEAKQKSAERTAAPAGSALQADVDELALPGKDGAPGRVILAGARLDLKPGEKVLLTGPSGSGKSTLVRILAGIWPFGRARVSIPQGARLMFLPQKPYIPIGSLRDAREGGFDPLHGRFGPIPRHGEGFTVFYAPAQSFAAPC